MKQQEQKGQCGQMNDVGDSGGKTLGSIDDDRSFRKFLQVEAKPGRVAGSRKDNDSGLSQTTGIVSVGCSPRWRATRRACGFPLRLAWNELAADDAATEHEIPPGKTGWGLAALTAWTTWGMGSGSLLSLTGVP